MSVGWECLPLLPLKCMLEHLPLPDAIAAMSVCRQWRTGTLIFEGHKDLLTLRTKEIEKDLFLARMFRKNVQRLHVYVDCDGEDLHRFFDIVLPKFFESVKLKEIIFIGPKYLQQTDKLPAIKLNRVITESLVLRNSQCLALIGCEMDVANEHDRYIHEQIKYYTSPLSFSTIPTPADLILSSSNASMMVYSSLQHIIIDYDQLTTESLETLSHLPMFNYLSMVISRGQTIEPLDWARLEAFYPNPLDVALHIVALPYKRFNEVIDNVLVRGISLVSLKVLYCKTIYPSLLSHVSQCYKQSLREMVWADDPIPADSYEDRAVATDSEACHINPFIFLCWQCVNLRRLVIHGYWIWQYDILGFVRLCKSLQQLEISSVSQCHVASSELTPDDVVLRRLATDRPTALHSNYVQEVNDEIEFEWRPIPWTELHPGLRTRATEEQKADYMLQEITNTKATIDAA